MHWILFFDGSVCKHGCSIGLLIISPWGGKIRVRFFC
uniref:Uncharacterized protein n=1 Tax=Arundo donax TaxID=35708 RepID=A0A0A9EC53_ARUDO